MSWKALVGCVLSCLALLGCGEPGEGRSAVCHARTASPLYYGTQEPGSLELNVASRHAIGAVEIGAGGELCSGTLVAPGWVLTAAHCNLREDLRFRPAGVGDDVYAVIGTSQHPSLDLLLLELDGSPPDAVPITPRSRPLDHDWLDRQGTLAGVGTTEHGPPMGLRFVDEPITEISDHTIVVDGDGRSGACVGDSGGPLLLADAQGQPEIGGVLSAGSASCVGVDVYVRVDQARAWIRDAIGQATGSCATDAPHSPGAAHSDASLPERSD